MAKPIDDLAAVFFRMLYEACNGNCVIAGGAALAYYLLPEKLYTNNSIDIFVPTLPQAMYEFTCCTIKIHPNCPTRGPTIQCIIDKVIRNLQHVHEISVQIIFVIYDNLLRRKVGAAVVAVRRGGAVPATVAVIAVTVGQQHHRRARSGGDPPLDDRQQPPSRVVVDRGGHQPGSVVEAAEESLLLARVTHEQHGGFGRVGGEDPRHLQHARTAARVVISPGASRDRVEVSAHNECLGRILVADPLAGDYVDNLRRVAQQFAEAMQS